MNQHKWGSQTVPEILPLCQEIVFAARIGSIAEASSLLNQLLGHLQRYLTNTNNAQGRFSKIFYSVETLGQMQAMQNWVAFADVLEYEFIPLWKQSCSTGQPPAS